MGFWNKSVWWIAAFVALSCLFALARTAETGSGAMVSGSSSGEGFYTIREDGQSGSDAGVREEGHPLGYSHVSSDP